LVLPGARGVGAGEEGDGERIGPDGRVLGRERVLERCGGGLVDPGVRRRHASTSAYVLQHAATDATSPTRSGGRPSATSPAARPDASTACCTSLRPGRPVGGGAGAGVGWCEFSRAI